MELILVPGDDTESQTADGGDLQSAMKHSGRIAASERVNVVQVELDGQRVVERPRRLACAASDSS